MLYDAKIHIELDFVMKNTSREEVRNYLRNALDDLGRETDYHERTEISYETSKDSPVSSEVSPHE